MLKKIMFLGLWALMLTGGWASVGYAQPFGVEEGLLRGQFKQKSGEKNPRSALLMFRPVPGRKESYFVFLGVIDVPGMEGPSKSHKPKIDPKDKDDRIARASLYIMDTYPKKEGHSLTPVELTADKGISIMNDHPSLYLTITKGKAEGELVVNIVGADAGNYRGIQGLFYFQSKVTETLWKDATEGMFSYKGEDSSLQIIKPKVALKGTRVEWEAIFKAKDFEGPKIIKEGQPQIFLIFRSRVFKTGPENLLDPRYFALFLKSCTGLDPKGKENVKEGLLLVDPLDSYNLKAFCNQ